MKKLLVGATFADDSPQQRRWLDLQLRYLAATTADYDHVAVVTSGLTNDHFSRATTTLVPDDTTLHASEAHVNALNLLLELFRSRAGHYENFLFLDGDAFPFRVRWLGSLLYRMEAQQQFDDGGASLPKQKGREYEVAVALRCENLETRLHASVLFAKACALPHLGFAIGPVGDDLAGQPELDIHIPSYQFERRGLAFPLLRSNQHNVHPLACGVYYDLFYHHCCGSGRWFNLRAKEYYDRVLRPCERLDAFTAALMDDPEEFVNGLAGWSRNRYAKLEVGRGQEVTCA